MRQGSLKDETMNEKIYNVLFLCTGNSARSVIAEVLLNKLGAGRFKAYSAGSHPVGAINSYTIELLKQKGLPVYGLTSKNWSVFAQPDAPHMDMIITVCDNAAGEVCPVWPGKPVSAHWGFEDPAAFEGPHDAKLAKFNQIYVEITARVRLLISMPVARLDRMTMQAQLREIGKTMHDAGA